LLAFFIFVQKIYVYYMDYCFHCVYILPKEWIAKMQHPIPAYTI
jgi:hypothetical protein